ncbi:MAG: hypothetical protein HUJ68_03580 [Clostridia bacterium]|nr:hypothetical protein [Clostridia bacterium]
MTKKGKRLLKIKLKTFKWDKTITPPLDVLIGVNLDLFSIQLIDNYGQERT